MKNVRKIVILSVLLFSFVLLNSDKAKASNALIDSYVTVNSIKKLSSGTISINYTMKKDFNKSLGGDHRV